MLLTGLTTALLLSYTGWSTEGPTLRYIRIQMSSLGVKKTGRVDAYRQFHSRHPEEMLRLEESACPDNGAFRSHRAHRLLYLTWEKDKSSAREAIRLWEEGQQRVHKRNTCPHAGRLTWLILVSCFGVRRVKWMTLARSLLPRGQVGNLMMWCTIWRPVVSTHNYWSRETGISNSCQKMLSLQTPYIFSSSTKLKCRTQNKEIWNRPNSRFEGARVYVQGGKWFKRSKCGQRWQFLRYCCLYSCAIRL